MEQIEVKEVITKIDTKKFKHIESIEFDGKIYKSINHSIITIIFIMKQIIV